MGCRVVSDRVSNYEYERRFLVEDTAVLDGIERHHQILQGYLWSEEGYAVRVRSRLPAGGLNEEPSCFLTVKGPRSQSRRFEVEMAIPREEALELIRLAPMQVVKKRYQLSPASGPWVVDVFMGRNDGLVIAEYEASQHEVEHLVIPSWAGREITSDMRFNNEELARHPQPHSTS